MPRTVSSDSVRGPHADEADPRRSLAASTEDGATNGAATAPSAPAAAAVWRKPRRVSAGGGDVTGVRGVVGVHSFFRESTSRHAVPGAPGKAGLGTARPTCPRFTSFIDPRRCSAFNHGVPDQYHLRGWKLSAWPVFHEGDGERPPCRGCGPPQFGSWR